MFFFLSRELQVLCLFVWVSGIHSFSPRKRVIWIRKFNTPVKPKSNVSSERSRIENFAGLLVLLRGL